jgi:multiple sugar transport system permease protein
MIKQKAAHNLLPAAATEIPLSRRLKILLGQDWNVAWLFMIPTVVLMGGIILFPFLRAVYQSFTNTTTLDLGPWVGLRNYKQLLGDKFYLASLVTTAKFTFWSVFLKAIVGTIAAVLLNRISGKATILIGLVLLPWIMPDIVRAITWKTILDPLYGAVSIALMNLHLIKQPLAILGDVKTALAGVVMVNLWQGIPFFTINLLAGLKSIDQELYEAAAIDGASSWRQFLHITLPGLRYVMIVVTLLSTIWTFNGFSLVFLLTAGGPLDATKMYTIYSYGMFNGRQYSMSVAAALFTAPLLAFFIVILGRYMMRGRTLYEDTSVGEPGIVSVVLGWIVRPFQWILGGALALFWFVNDGIELGFEALGRAVRRLRGISDDVAHVSHTPKWVGRVPAWIALALLLTFELLPFYFVIVTSFKSQFQVSQFISIFWPAPWSTMQYERLLGPARNFAVWLRNTIIISSITPVISTVVAAASAYALTRLRWKGSSTFSSAVLVAYLMPGIMMVVPIYQIFSKLHIANTLWSLIFSYPTFSLPFAIWLMMGYYASIPEELEAAALVDGCNRIQAFFQIVLPLTRPALAAVALFGVTMAWSEFLFAYIMISRDSQMTIPVGLSMMIIGDVVPWGELCAAALIMTIPVLVLYTLGQKYMVGGLTAGAVKGGG